MKIPVGGVGFFDSGVGGLTVLNCCQKYFTGENLYYLGDNERAPYGNLPPALIARYVRESFDLFERLQAKAAVIACNTVTALCVEELRARYSFPIIGAEPAVLSAARRGGEVFVLTTRATFNSARFCALCEKARQKYPQARLRLYACDALAGGIEERFGEDGYDFTRFLPRGSPDAVVLGCTHYLYIKEQIKNFYGCEVFDGNEGIARRLRWQLSNGTRADTVGQTGRKTGVLQGATEKDRDGRPPLEKPPEKIGIFDHFFGQKRKAERILQKTNECSPVKTRKSLIIRGVAQKNELYFLGSGGVKNKNFYERMFVF